MSTHHGKTIEKVIRKNGHSVSGIARAVGVNRRSVYNWFNQPYLKADLLIKIGKAIEYDLSEILPHMRLTIENFTPFPKKSNRQTNDPLYWKNKYTDLLKRYNNLILIVAPSPKRIDKN
jgi:lambda repressor-like predicted transcriptional regulator